MSDEQTPTDVEEAAPEQPQVDGIALTVNYEGGSVNIDAIQILGTTRPSEVQTILELGIKEYRQRAGL